MTEEPIIIIGAGIAGLATGCYAQMNGYRTQIFELHTLPGGLCTAWKRKGYTFDGCIHWLTGSGPGSGLYSIWEELGAVQGRPMVYHEEFIKFQGPNDKSFNVYTDIDRLEEHMLTLSPADARLIEAYARAARLFTHIDLLALPVLKPREMLNLLPFAGTLIRWGRITMRDFATRFSDPFLRQVFPLIHGCPALPMAGHLANLAGWHSHNAGWPAGGSLPFSRAIERRYLDLGGKIHYRSRVDKVLVDTQRPGRRPSRAVGVRLADRSEHRAAAVISAADGHTTIFDMLGGEFLNDQIRAYYAVASGKQGPSKPGSTIQVSLGVARDLSKESHTVALLLDQPLTIAGEVRDRLTMEHYCFDPTIAPPGKSVVEVWLDSSYAYWKGISDHRERYEAEKQRAASAVIGQLERLYPRITEQIEVVDVATPLTIERYTGNWHGCQAWFPTRNMVGVMLKGLSRRLPGLEDFYMVGQWAGAAGGLSNAAISGRKLVEGMCKRDGREFVTTVV